MLIVRVELHSAITGKVTELARMMIANEGTGSRTLGNYRAEIYRGRDKAALDLSRVQNARERLHVWHLVGRMLGGMGYGA